MTINYLEFTENNIEFRISSSKMMERYKNTQSFVLSEMLYGEYKFSKTSKEIAILTMDIVFGWMVTLENYLIRDRREFFDERARLFSTESVEKARDYYIKVITSHKDIFREDIIEVWLDLHRNRFKMIISVLDSCVGMKDIDAFSYIINTLTEAMDALKFELYEIDYLTEKGKRPFLCLSDLPLVILRDFGENQLLFRSEVYKKHFNVGEHFILKNYSQEHNPIVFIRELEDNGITIDNKQSVLHSSHTAKE